MDHPDVVDGGFAGEGVGLGVALDFFALVDDEEVAKSSDELALQSFL